MRRGEMLALRFGDIDWKRRLIVLHQRLEALQAAIERLERGKAFDAGSDATEQVSRIFQVPADQSFAERSDLSKEIFRSN